MMLPPDDRTMGDPHDDDDDDDDMGVSDAEAETALQRNLWK